MDINLQLFTGGCKAPAKLDTKAIIRKIHKILKKTKIRDMSRKAHTQ